ncbi:APC family permease [Nocardia asteroides]|uniref:APC family permease n=1 Tax=Nocardia asteroides TaxID=1824 RepID=UPI001E554C33|nr:APC family permease [Nocardia asteroides]UGT55958.1 APC family permease [Nocardia asteroides]
MTIDDPNAPPVQQDSEGAQRLRGNLGIIQLVFTVLAFNGPLGVVAAFAPVVIGYGNGIGAPAAYVAAAAIVGVFAVGFLKMSRHITNPGGFYSFVTAGLGKEIGLGASFLAVTCYYILLLAVYSVAGLYLQTVVGGMSWWLWALVLQAVVGVFGYFNLDFSAKALSVCLCLEVVLVAVYDVFVVAKGGATGITADSFLLENIFSGNVGIALLFGMLCMGGFEVTVIFRDEVRDPDRTIPRATYLFIALIGLVYAVSTWAIIQAIGPADAAAQTAADPTGSFLNTLSTYVGTVVADLVVPLLVTAGFAAVLATHNVLARYAFNLGVDEVLPQRIGYAHPRHGSPHLASVIVSVLAVVGFMTFVVLGAEPKLLYAQLSGAFGYGLITLMLLTSLSVLVFMARRRPDDTTLWHRRIAPGVALICLAIVLWLATTNISALITAGTGVVVGMLALLYGSVLLGAVYARKLRSSRPATYAKIGRQ